MRKIVCQMMMTLNGRVDDPMAWAVDLSDEQYRFIDAAYAEFDTVIVGRVTYDEMSAFWPKAREDKEASAPHRSMAGRMHRYRKIVVTSTDFTPEWNNCEAFVCKGDDDLKKLVAQLKNAGGSGIHLSGGARLAQSFARLDLIDAYTLMVNPVISPGKGLFANIEDQAGLRAKKVAEFPGDVVALRYTRAQQEGTAQRQSFDDMMIKKRS